MRVQRGMKLGIGNSNIMHYPVLSDEVIEYLACAPGLTIVDGTVGSGGHAKRIASEIGASGVLIGIDRDPEQLERAREALSASVARVQLVHNSYDAVNEILEECGMTQVDGVLLDLGLSQQHLDNASSGMSFRFKDAPLDLRFDPTEDTPTAAELIATSTEAELARIFKEYGELPNARALSRALVAERMLDRIERVGQLEAIAQRVIRNHRLHNPMTLVLQALRIAVNDELGRLERALEQWATHLKPGGRIVVISYHSLEDRIVKTFFRFWQQVCICPPSFPVCRCHHKAILKVITSKPVQPTLEEARLHPTTRSARLRVAERI